MPVTHGPGVWTDPVSERERPPAIDRMVPFGLFLLVLAVLFLRPTELVPALENAPVYEVAILSALAAEAGRVLGQLSRPALIARPVTAFVLALGVVVVLSHLARFSVGPALASGFSFAKLILLYLLAVANLRTVTRMRVFLVWLVVLVGCQAGLAVLQYWGYINFEALKPYSQRVETADGEGYDILPRLCGAGIFHDPNDLCVLLSLGAILCLYLLGDRRLGVARFVAVAPLAVFAAGVPLTHSRGGLLALLGGLAVLGAGRLGARRAAVVAAVVGPVMLVALGGRMTKFDMDNPDDTSQHRIRAWSDGLLLLNSAPLFGIGHGNYADEVGLDAHNSFVHEYTELGFVGGTCFFAVFAYTGWALWRLRRRLDPVRHPTLSRLRPYLLAVLVAFAVGLLSLSRGASPPTYLIFAVFAAYLALAGAAAPGSVPRLTQKLVVRLTLASAATLAAIKVGILLLVRW